VAGSSELVVREVTVRAGELTILSGVDFALHPGEMCGLIGPSGAGKTTLIKVLLGLKRAASGEVTLGGGPTTSRGPVGYVPQDDALHRSLTVRQTLDYAARLRLIGLDEAGRAARIDEVCQQVDLAHRLDVRVRRLSGGQRKRLAVAVELLSAPGLLILDEPTSGLDPGLEAKMMTRFQQVARGGCTVIVATHAMQSLDRCDALLVMVAGNIAWFGAPADALAWFKADSLAGIFNRIPLRKPEAWDRVWRASGERAQFAARPAPLITPSKPLITPSKPARTHEAPARPPAAPRPTPTAPTTSPEAPAPRAKTPEEQLAELKARLKK